MRAIVDKFESLLGALDGVIRWVLVFALFAMTAVLFFNSIGRSVFNISFVGGPTLGRLLIIWLTFLGGYLAVRSGSHITVDILQRLLPAHAVRMMPIPIGLFGAATTGYITWLSAIFTWTRFSAGQIDPMLEIPSGFFYLPVPIGGLLMTMAFLQVALKCLADNDNSRSDSPTPTSRAS
ncbi:MAG: TRAP transporter small permease [Gammaproteobacteria bacterium]|nr:TRAP transporter small permease [Gammaproteobacteria bacterium]